MGAAQSSTLITDDDAVAAAKGGDKTAVEQFLGQGRDVNFRDRGHYTLLMWAAGHGRLSIVQLLLSNGALPNARDHDVSRPHAPCLSR